MNQFTVPQFIDVEDKIFGPVTTRQFIILLAAGLILFVAFKLADTVLFIVLLALIGGFSLILAFVKINGQPFHYFMLNLVQTKRRPTRRLWRKGYTDAELKVFVTEGNKEEDEVEARAPEKQTESLRIHNLSLLVNTGGYYRPEDHV